jgi:hypothetical protein
MPAVDPRLSIRLPLISLLGILLLGFAWMPAASAQAAYVRVSQVGYETGRHRFAHTSCPPWQRMRLPSKFSTRRELLPIVVPLGLRLAPGATARQRGIPSMPSTSLPRRRPVQNLCFGTSRDDLPNARRRLSGQTLFRSTSEHLVLL